MLHVCKFIPFFLFAFVYGFSSEHCSTNCSVWSANVDHPNLQHLVSCRITNETCRSKQSTSDVTEPKLHPLDWSIKNTSNGDSKIVLQIVLEPMEDGTVEFLTGYKLVVIRVITADKFKSATRDFATNFCFDHDLDFTKHAKLQIQYNCYGLHEPYSIDPGDRYKVQIYNHPDMHEVLKLTISIPDCSSKRLENFPLCVEQSRFLVVTSYKCHEHAVDLNYSVPHGFGLVTAIEVCKFGTNECWNVSSRLDTLRGSVRIFFTTEQMKLNYTLTVYATERFDLTRSQFLTFGTCLDAFHQDLVNMIAAALSVAVVLVVISVLVVKKFCPRRNRSEQADVEVVTSLIKTEDLCENQSYANDKTLLLIYANDNEQYEKFTQAFSDYLEEDLNFTILDPVKKVEELYGSIEKWTIESLSKVDKVLIISSPVMDKIFKEICTKSDLDDSIKDSLSFLYAICKIAAAKIFREVHSVQNKFFYCVSSKCECVVDSLENILIDKELKMFLKLYFQIIEVEQYSIGKELTNSKITNYTKENVTKHGSELREAIERLRDLHCSIRNDEVSSLASQVESLQFMRDSGCENSSLGNNIQLQNEDEAAVTSPLEAGESSDIEQAEMEISPPSTTDTGRVSLASSQISIELQVTEGICVESKPPSICDDSLSSTSNHDDTASVASYIVDNIGVLTQQHLNGFNEEEQDPGYVSWNKA